MHGRSEPVDLVLVSPRPRWASVRILKGTRRFVRLHPLGAIGGAVLVLLALTAALAGIISPFNPDKPDYATILAAPSSRHVFGTDSLGRDLLSRIIFGARVSLTVASFSVLFASVAGVATGIAAAHYRGWIDASSQRIVDALLAFPTLVLALAIVTGLGASLHNVITALTVVFVSTITRVVRAAGLSVEAHEFIAAARAVGATDLRIMLLYVMPNILPSFLIIATVLFGQAVLIEGSLSFLGLGIPPPTASWGGMLSGPTLTLAEKAPWLIIFPGAAISMVVYGANLLGDAIRDASDPRLRGSRG